MKISEQWLREWVDPDITSDELVAQLTNAGLEVDSVEPVAPAFNGVVVGRVLEVMQHPNADRLKIAKVNIGQETTLEIVCGAPNIRSGMCAPTAVIGAVLPGIGKIEASELRGIVSQGMLCSARELGLGDDADGLLVLPDASTPGSDFRSFLGLDDKVIDVDLTPNRGDCLGIAGIAREVGVLNRCPVTTVAIEPVAPESGDTFAVTLSAPADCPRYVGRVIRGVDARASTPLWMREKLRRAGLRSLGPLVDITNYVMLELGQPMHAFDLGKLSGGIDVRRARAGENLELLNGQQVKLEPDVLLITDATGPVALAGIMGGESSAVDDNTRDVFLESAFFSPLAISGRARRYGLHTDASHRFERGVDPDLQARAVERYTRLLLDIAGGQPGPIIDTAIHQYIPIPSSIVLRPSRIKLLLGMGIAANDVVDILTRLGMDVFEEDDHWRVTPPGFRFDITMEADLIEELGRIYGYDRLPTSRPHSPLAITPQPESRVSIARMRETLVQRGFQEVITYSFVDPGVQRLFDPERPAVPLTNPISADLAVMRTSLWPGLVKALQYNQKRQQARVRLFECGLNFIGTLDDLDQEGSLGGIVCGSALPEQWSVAQRNVDFFDLKGDVEALLDLTGQAEAFNFISAKHPALHPGQTARIERDGERIGWIGALHPAMQRALDLEQSAFVFELRIGSIRLARQPLFTDLSKFPISRRDLAIIVAEDISAQAVQDCIRAQASECLREIRLFDVYRGESVGQNQKSLAFGLILQDFSRNLRDQEVDNIISEIVSGLNQQFGARLRV